MQSFSRENGPDAGENSTDRSDRFFLAITCVGVFTLIFLFGALSVVVGYFPGPVIERAYKGGMAWYDKLTRQHIVYDTDLWVKSRYDGKGVTFRDSNRMQPGVTLYTSGSAPAAFLVDEEGKLLHEWRLPFSQFHQTGDGGPENPQPDEYVYFRQARVAPGGELIALYEGAGDTPYGYGLVKLDRNSKVIWKYTGRTHHQFDIAPDGRIFVLTHAIESEVMPVYANLETPRIDDYLVTLSPDGQVLNTVTLLQSFADSQYRQLVYTVSAFSRADPLHTNTVEYIDAAKAANFPFGKEGQVLLSFRETHSIGVVDPETGELPWVARGPWIGQHDPDILPNGNILMFDNYGNFKTPEGRSRVIEFSPATMEIVWQYRGTADDPLESAIRSDQQRLANGNTLITESSGGRIIEVTPQGDLVWQFVNPVRGGEEETQIPIIAWAMRLDRAVLDEAVLSGENTLDNKEISQ
ncbi:arylsulfotransferase family protein [Kordiimonas aestuarii]|uniref:arylsulfotransferase family protein n=1 Tax=Kordiimonas aestuarii TaxID=1005925 RepID=UPI0021CDF45A|nr:arylsulfotransferase family protein [Kordiimonas aestuarii]